jgi:hypothetical protein
MKKNKWRYKTRHRYDGMIYRCYNTAGSGYKNYGARGIYVCDRWLGPEGMLHFFEDMGDPPLKRSLDRIDNDGPYSPENCRWATWSEQCRNKRSNTLIKLREKEMCLAEALEKAGIEKGTYKARVRKGMTPEEALTTKLRKRAPNKKH